jgi:hypothetical protein
MLQKLEIGCGQRPTPGYIHNDLNAFEGVDIVDTHGRSDRRGRGGWSPSAYHRGDEERQRARCRVCTRGVACLVAAPWSLRRGRGGRNYVDPEQLAIPRACFRALDVSAPFSLGRQFDLVHLPLGLRVRFAAVRRLPRPLVDQIARAKYRAKHIVRC